MKILMIGFGKVNKCLYEFVKDDVVGIVTENEENIYGIPDIIIDFSHPDSLDKIIKYTKKHNAKVIIGTTGYDKEKMAQIKELSRYTSVLKSENFSLGIAIIKNMLTSNKNKISNYNKTIIERHNINKKDSPSGTALVLGEILKTNNFICLRDTDIIGEHTIILENDYEKITIIHEVFNRELFIQGILKSLNWLVNQEAGLYTFEDVHYE